MTYFKLIIKQLIDNLAMFLIRLLNQHYIPTLELTWFKVQDKLDCNNYIYV